MNFDVVIIGGGPVGIFSIFACGMQKLSCAIVDSMDKLGGQCAKIYPEKAIYDIPGFKKITGKGLVDNLLEQAEPFKYKSYLNSNVLDIKKEDGVFKVKLADESIITGKSVIIAAGAGIFEPNRPDLEHILSLEGKSVLYFIDNFEIFKNKKVMVAGGGDSALDWVINIAPYAEKLFLVHRRDSFKAQPSIVDEMNALPNLEKIIPFTLGELHQENFELKSVTLKDMKGNVRKEEVDFLLPCYGLKNNLRFLESWGLELESGKVVVNPTTMQTSIKGIYAIGDCVAYNNKRKLILTGFSEASQAALDIFSYVFPDKAPLVGHSTTLGVPS